MLHQFHLPFKNEDVYINIPDEFNEQTTIKILELAEKEEYGDSKFIKHIKKVEQSDVDPEIEIIDLHVALHPSLFISFDEETKQITPDMKYFQLIDKNYFKRMMYFWSLIDDYSTQELLDEIEKSGTEHIADTALITNIIE